MTKPAAFVVHAFLAVVAATTASSSAARGEARQFATTASQVSFDQQLGEQVPLDAEFRDESGADVRLGSYFGRRPVVLALIFHRCPLLCNQVLTGLTRSLKPLPLEVGADFDVLAVSIDPEDTPETAARKKAGYLEQYDRPGNEEGWHFLTGRKEAIDALCKSVGFRYVYDAQKKIFAHAAGVVVLTPGGQAAQYFYGIEYPAKELDGAIRRSASGRIGSRIAKLLLLCYDYDATTGKYTLSIVRLLRVLGTLTASSLGVYLLVMFRRDRLERLGGGPRPDGSTTTSVPEPGL